MRYGRKLTDAEEQEIAALYAEGASLKSLATQYRCDFKLVKRALARQGMRIRKRGASFLTWTDEERDRIVRLYVEEGWSQNLIGKELGHGQVTISRLLRTQGVHRGNHARGERHGSWKGGRVVYESGYVYVRVDEFPEMHTSNGYISEHRLAMARHLGRPLLKHEQVHHKDGNKENNVIENLELRIGAHGNGATAPHCPTCTCFRR